MCGRAKISMSAEQYHRYTNIRNNMAVAFPEHRAYQPKHNIAPGNQIPVVISNKINKNEISSSIDNRITPDKNNMTAKKDTENIMTETNSSAEWNSTNTTNFKVVYEKSIKLMTWGLIPSFTKYESIANPNPPKLSTELQSQTLIDANSSHQEKITQAIQSSVFFKMFNARAETLFERPSFRRLVSSGYGSTVNSNHCNNQCHFDNRNKRCIVILDGFYEWKMVTINGKKQKQPFFISLKGCGSDSSVKSQDMLHKHAMDTMDVPMKCAALYDCLRVPNDEADSPHGLTSGHPHTRVSGVKRKGSDSVSTHVNLDMTERGTSGDHASTNQLYTCTLVTVPSNAAMSAYHHRMPLMLQTDEEVERWLQGDEYNEGVVGGTSAGSSLKSFLEQYLPTSSLNTTESLSTVHEDAEEFDEVMTQPYSVNDKVESEQQSEQQSSSDTMSNSIADVSIKSNRTIDDCLQSKLLLRFVPVTTKMSSLSYQNEDCSVGITLKEDRQISSYFKASPSPNRQSGIVKTSINAMMGNSPSHSIMSDIVSSHDAAGSITPTKTNAGIASPSKTKKQSNMWNCMVCEKNIDVGNIDPQFYINKHLDSCIS